MKNDENRTRRRFIAGTGVALAVGLAGCTGSTTQDESSPGGGSTSPTETEDGHSDDGGHGSSLDGPEPSASVKMATTDGGTHFEPHVVWVERGGTVTWKLESGNHTATAYAGANGPERIPEGAKGWNSGTLSEQGATFEHTFETTGVYDYFCTPHEATGMVGTVVVGEPEADGEPGLQPPQEDLPDGAASKIESLNQRVTKALGDDTEQTHSADGSEESGHSH